MSHTVREKNNVLSQFRHLKRMGDERMAKKIQEGKVNPVLPQLLLPLVREVGENSVDLRKHIIKGTKGRPHNKHEDPPEGLYEEVDNSEHGVWRPVFSDYSARDKA